MAASGRFCLAAALVALVQITSGVAGSEVTDILVDNGLPKGLLPGTVKSYDISDDGSFQVTLTSACKTKISTEEVSYKQSISGKLSYGKITNLAGIQAKEFFWISITSIEVDKNNPNILWFEVGFFAKSLSTDLFQEPPVCNSLAEEDRAAMRFSEWVEKALSGTLEQNLPRGGVSGVARRHLQ